MLPYHLLPNDYNESNKNDTQITERNRPGFLRRTLCRQIATLAREGQTFHRGILNQNGHSQDNTVQLGIGNSDAAIWNASKTCGSTRREGPNSYAGSLKEKFLEKSPKWGYCLLTFPHFGEIIESVTMQVPGSSHRIRLTTGRPVPPALHCDI